MQRLGVDKLFNGKEFLTEQVLTLDDGCIIAIDDNIAHCDVRISNLLAPGFIDLQVNGGGGVLFNSDTSLAGLKQMLVAHNQYGTTAMLPTLITDKVDVMLEAANAVAEAILNKTQGIIGIHFEGPHLSIAKKGAHSAEFIRPISEQEWQILSRRDLGVIIVTLAPEQVLASDIRRMIKLGIKVCLGHTNATFAQAQQALEAGADGFTHLFNAMSPLQGREPGVVGSALLNDQASCGLIADGHHVDFNTCQLAIKTKPKGKLFLVTDAMPPVGTKQNSFTFFDRTVTLSNGKLTSSTGELAGSVLGMVTAVRNIVKHTDTSLSEALKMASLYPAIYIGQEQIVGSIKVGQRANFVELDDELNLVSTWMTGNKVYSTL